MKSRGSSIRRHIPYWCKSLLWLLSALPTGIVCAKTSPELPPQVNEPMASATSPSAQATGRREAILARETLPLRDCTARSEQENKEAPTSTSQTLDTVPLTGGTASTENLSTNGKALSLPAASDVRADGAELPVAPQMPAPEVRTTPAEEKVSSPSSGAASVSVAPAVSGNPVDDTESSIVPQEQAVRPAAVPAEDLVVPASPGAVTPVNIVPSALGIQADGAESSDGSQTSATAKVPVTGSSSVPAPVSTAPVSQGLPTVGSEGAEAPQTVAAPAAVSVTSPVHEQSDPTPDKVTPVQPAPAVSGKAVSGPEVPETPRLSVPLTEAPVSPADVSVSPRLRTTPAEKTASPGPSEQIAPRILSEAEQNSYVLGMMVADYARTVLRTLDKLDVRPDEKLFREGLQDTLSGRPLLEENVARAAMQRIQKEADSRQAGLDAASRQALVEIAGKHNTVEKKEDRIWVRLKKGGPAVSKQTPLSLSWEGQFYNGAVFESVTDAAVTRREVLPSWLQRAIRLAGPGGEVRLFILAGSLEGEAPLPAGTGRHELVQYTVSVKKG